VRQLLAWFNNSQECFSGGIDVDDDIVQGAQCSGNSFMCRETHTYRTGMLGVE
jgi:hypothetical protein